MHKVVIHSPPRAAKGGLELAQIIGAVELSQAVATGSFIKEGDPSCVEGVKYDFRLGEKILKGSFARPTDAGKVTEEERRRLLVVEPDEMVFVLSKESLDLPKDMIAQLSPKRKMSHDGIAVMGGLCIDPLYKGHLVIGLHNLSSVPYSLMPGRKLIAAVFFRLAAEELSDFPTPIPLYDFPDDVVRAMRNYQPTSLASIQSNLNSMAAEITHLRGVITQREDWFKNIEQAIDGQKDRINELISALSSETAHRAEGDKDLEERLAGQSTTLSAINTKLTWVSAITIVAGTLLGAVIVPIIVNWISAKIGL